MFIGVLICLWVFVGVYGGLNPTRSLRTYLGRYASKFILLSRLERRKHVYLRAVIACIEDALIALIYKLSVRRLDQKNVLINTRFWLENTWQKVIIIIIKNNDYNRNNQWLWLFVKKLIILHAMGGATSPPPTLPRYWPIKLFK